VIPPWTLLPYELLLDIFRFAADPLIDDANRITGAVSWLCAASRTCKAFAEPALSVLYESPPLDTPIAALRLLDLLKSEAPTYINYKVKVKRLDLDILYVMTYKAGAHGHVNLSDMFAVLPNVSSVHLRHMIYRPPFRPYIRQLRPWFYSQDIFTSITEYQTRLDSWIWSANMLNAQVPDAFNPEMTIHSSTTLANLRDITLAGFEIGSLLDDLANTQSAAIKKRPPKMRSVHCLKSLTQLRNLTFISCTSSTWDILSALPCPLTTLTIINSNIISTTLSDYLEEHGQSLTTLVLNHNDHLDLNFLPILHDSCPSLTELFMDLTYYNPLAILEVAADPVYASLLEDDSIPTWPSTLQRLSLLHLRRWSTHAALNFLQSLVE